MHRTSDTFVCLNAFYHNIIGVFYRLHLAYYFYLHYEEIMDWYGKMDGRAAYICVVPESLEQCERNKESFQTDNDLTVQAYDRVMIEAQQLLQSLKQQHELLVIENAEAVLHVQLLCKNIGSSIPCLLFVLKNSCLFKRIDIWRRKNAGKSSASI
jgi:hypothetical protein